MEFALVEWSMSDVARASIIYAMVTKLGWFGKGSLFKILYD